MKSTRCRTTSCCGRPGESEWSGLPCGCSARRDGICRSTWPTRRRRARISCSCWTIPWTWLRCVQQFTSTADVSSHVAVSLPSSAQLSSHGCGRAADNHSTEAGEGGHTNPMAQHATIPQHRAERVTVQGPIRKTIQDDPHSTSHSRSRRSTGPRARTNEATRTGPTAEQATMTRRTLRREEWVIVQDPVRKPTKDEMSPKGGGGGGSPSPPSPAPSSSHA